MTTPPPQTTDEEFLASVIQVLSDNPEIVTVKGPPGVLAYAGSVMCTPACFYRLTDVMKQRYPREFENRRRPSYVAQPIYRSITMNKNDLDIVRLAVTMLAPTDNTQP